MPVILVQRILELELLAARQGLRPLRTLLIAKNPAGHVFGLDHENAEARNDDVVDLRRALAGGQRDVVDVFVDVGIEEDFFGDCGLQLSKQSLQRRLIRGLLN